MAVPSAIISRLRDIRSTLDRSAASLKLLPSQKDFRALVISSAEHSYLHCIEVTGIFVPKFRLH
jgi:hypothetical protein